MTATLLDWLSEASFGISILLLLIRWGRKRNYKAMDQNVNPENEPYDEPTEEELAEYQEKAKAEYLSDLADQANRDWAFANNIQPY